MTSSQAIQTQERLFKDLQTLGIHSGDTVMVHASMRALGTIEGRAEGLIRSLLRALGTTGTLMAYVDYEPTEEYPYFAPEHSPASHDYGVLAEEIRRWPDARRSLNPGASCVAIGNTAQWLCAGHPIQYGYGPGSPFAKLCEASGKVLLLGSHLDHVTLLHHAEHLAQLPDKRILKRQDKIYSNGALQSLEIEEYDTGLPIMQEMPEDYFAQITAAFIQKGFAQTGHVGQAHSYLLPAHPFVGFAIEKMEREYGSNPQ